MARQTRCELDAIERSRASIDRRHGGIRHASRKTTPVSVSEKTAIIEALFEARYRGGTILEDDRLVSLEDVAAAINEAKKAGTTRLRTGNTANFMKDIVRSNNRNNIFPRSVVERGWTAQQATGEGSFRFIPLPPGQATAFNVIGPPDTCLDAPHAIQSLSLVPEAREYGRRDESWLTQVATDLSIVQTHFALHHGEKLKGLALLASNIKLGNGEVDALYYGTAPTGDRYLLACEMKSRREVMDEQQILSVANALKATSATEQTGVAVIPVGVKVVDPVVARGTTGLIWVRAYGQDFPPLEVKSEGVYQLVPAVPGID